MTVIASVYTPEGFVVAADGLRRDGNTLETLSENVQKVFFGRHPSFSFIYSLSGKTGFTLPNGVAFRFQDEVELCVTQMQSESCNSISEYAQKVGGTIADRLRVSNGGLPILFEDSPIARLLLVGYFSGIAERAEVWFAGENGNIRSHTKNLATEPDDFGIFSGSKEVFYSMVIARQPATLFEGIMLLERYMRLCIEGNGKIPDCDGYGGHVHVASISPDGPTWVIPPLNDSDTGRATLDNVVLSRLLNAKPLTKAEISAKIKEAKKIQKMDTREARTRQP